MLGRYLVQEAVHQLPRLLQHHRSRETSINNGIEAGVLGEHNQVGGDKPPPLLPQGPPNRGQHRMIEPRRWSWPVSQFL